VGDGLRLRSFREASQGNTRNEDEPAAETVYHYDDQGNWTEKKVSYRSSPDGALTSSSEATRTLEYF
jgi:hypothetical protein